MRSRGPDPVSLPTPVTVADCEGPAVRRFEDWAAHAPERPAVRIASSSTSYGALERLANRVAHELLRSLGARPEPVALLLAKGAPLIGALLGVLKAGKPYVGLDPAHPVEHGRYVVEDSGAPLLLADAAHAEAARALAGASSCSTGSTSPATRARRPSRSPATRWPRSSTPRARLGGPRGCS